jgi:hypothetical protein
VPDPIRDELHRLNEEFKKLLGNSSSIHVSEKTLPEHLIRFGLTTEEARAWLEQEPNFFTSRRIFTDKPDRRRLDRTLETQVDLPWS